MTRKTAKISICVAWAYSISIGLPLALLKPDGDLQLNNRVACYFNRAAASIWRGSMIALILLIIFMQVLTYGLLRRRLNTVVATLQISVGKIKLYKRAMKTCAQIAVAFFIGWMPIAIGSLLFDWLPGNRGVLMEVNHYFRILFILQGFSNVVIFRLRNLYPKIQSICREKCCCKSNINTVHPMQGTLRV